MCSLVAHDKIQPNGEDYESSIGDRSIPKYAKIEALKSLGAIINFIDIWLKFFLGDYGPRCDEYFNAMKEMFKKIPQNMSQPLTPKQKSPETYDRYWWWMVYEKNAKGIPPSRRPKLSKKSQENQDEIQKKLYEANKWWNDRKLQLQTCLFLKNTRFDEMITKLVLNEILHHVGMSWIISYDK